MQKLVRSLLILLAACSRRELPPLPSTQTTAPPPPVTASAPAPPAAPDVEGPKLKPVDEGTSDPSLVKFREELLAAIRRRDQTAVLGALHPNVKTNFGGGGGLADFRKQWTSGSSQEDIWQVLETVLLNGGTWQKPSGDAKRFWAPYVYSAWPETSDAFESLAVTADNVPLRETADPASAVIATLRWDIVQRAEVSRRPSDAQFMQVRTADGRQGWVETKYVRSPVDYRAGLVKTDKGWKIDALVAGD